MALVHESNGLVAAQRPREPAVSLPDQTTVIQDHIDRLGAGEDSARSARGLRLRAAPPPGHGPDPPRANRPIAALLRPERPGVRHSSESLPCRQRARAPHTAV